MKKCEIDSVKPAWVVCLWVYIYKKKNQYIYIRVLFVVICFSLFFFSSAGHELPITATFYERGASSVFFFFFSFARLSPQSRTKRSAKERLQLRNADR